jgi:hypothetical protein
MYRFKRDKKIQAKFKLGNNIITVSLDPFNVMREFGKRHKTLEVAEKAAIAAAGRNDADEIFEAYGNAIFAVMDLFFGETDRKKIVDYYENNSSESP